MFVLVDTPIVIWLYANKVEKLSAFAREHINSNRILIPNAARLEIQYMYERGCISKPSQTICDDLACSIHAQLPDLDCSDLIYQSMDLTWATDPFDRLIAAEAMIRNTILITPDENIRSNLRQHAAWDSMPS